MAPLSRQSIKSLYPLALAEGEGVGTAYEYFAKRLVLGSWLANRPKPRSLLIAGLPEKYGCSLDFFLLAHEWGIRPVVVDDRARALDKLRGAIAAAQADGELLSLEVDLVLVDAPERLRGLGARFDLALCSEVLQGISAENRPDFVAAVSDSAEAFALFSPNADNAAHTDLSGLAGLTLSELTTLVSPLIPHSASFTSGYIDMPPFPPGITRDETQREHASSGKLEAVAMWGLGHYARAERWLPASVRRAQSHIVYAFCER